ncbi:MAG TPA: hypothetical protein VK395_13800 [Gemmataceae bacterium]|nr:hypothetical protein [Gemmataceae bacterium]
MHTLFTERELGVLRRPVTTDHALGSQRRVEGIAKRLGLDLRARPRRRPRKWGIN